MTTLNVDLLNKVKKHFLDEPRRLRMDTWLKQGYPNQEIFSAGISGYNEPEEYLLPQCGTVGCIAGWTVMLAYPNDPSKQLSPSLQAREVLGIDEYIMPYDLFFPDQWPSDFYRDYRNAESPEERARIACEVIDHFVKMYAQNEIDHTILSTEDDED